MHVDQLLLVIDRDQSAWENFVLPAWFFLTTVCYIAAALPLPAALAAIAAIPLAALVVQVPLATGFGAKVNGALAIILLFVASSYFAVSESPVRYVAWFCLAVMILNAVAWLVMRILRDDVRELERKCAS